MICKTQRLEPHNFTAKPLIVLLTSYSCSKHECWKFVVGLQMLELHVHYLFCFLSSFSDIALPQSGHLVKSDNDDIDFGTRDMFNDPMMNRALSWWDCLIVHSLTGGSSDNGFWIPLLLAPSLTSYILPAPFPINEISTVPLWWVVYTYRM